MRPLNPRKKVEKIILRPPYLNGQNLDRVEDFEINPYE
jgi:hypothetical protein